MDEAVGKFLEHAGVMGPIVIFLGWYIWAKDKQIKAQHKQIIDLQENRINDAKGVNDGQMKLNDKWMEVLQSNTTALNEMRTVLTLIREDRARQSRRPPGGV